jgi:hypothetical protein
MKRSFLYLAAVTAVALLVVLFTDPGESPVSKAENDLLLPELSKQINAVDRVEIIAAGNSLVATMVKFGNGWQLEQMDGYSVDWPKLRTMLAELAQARVVENKTDNPEYYARLGVEDVGAADAGGVLVSLSVGNQTTGIIVGNEAEGRPGQYVRLQNEAVSALVDREIDVFTEALDWADTTIVDINASEVAEVEIIHPGGERVLVTRISADQTDFDFVGLPEGRETRSSWAVNSLGSVFSMLRMESVRPQDSLDWSDAVKLRLLMFSGVEIMADMVEANGEYLLRLKADHPAANVVRDQSQENESSIEQQEIKKQAADDVAKTVDDINRRVSGWLYAIPKYKYDTMVSKPEDLLKPLEQS